MQVTDPVCQRRIPLETVVAHREFMGWTYFFCSTECSQRFDEKPEKFALQQTGGPPSHVA